MDKREFDKGELGESELEALLDRLCERPFAQDAGGRVSPDVSPDVLPEVDDRLARAFSAGTAQDVGAAAAEGEALAALAAILSGTATEAQCRALRAAVASSAAVRLEAQSALAFIEAMDAAPRAAPAHLVDEILRDHATLVPDDRRNWQRVAAAVPAQAAAPAGVPLTAASPRRAWSWRSRGAPAAAFVVMLLGVGLGWSRLWQAGPVHDVSVVPAAAPAGMAVTAKTAAPFVPAYAPDIAPPAAPAIEPPAPRAFLRQAPVPVEAAARAAADPCPPRGSAARTAAAEAGPAKPTKSSPAVQSKVAAAAVPSPDCADTARAPRVAAPARASEEPAAALSNRSLDLPSSFAPPAAPAAQPPAAAFAPQR